MPTCIANFTEPREVEKTPRTHVVNLKILLTILADVSTTGALQGTFIGVWDKKGT